MWIEDNELREIFRTASEERLQAIDEGLLQLEQNPNNPELITAILREYRDWETDRKSTRLNSSHSAKSRMPSSA